MQQIKAMPTIQTQLPLPPERMHIFPTAGSLQEVLELGESRLPLKSKNDMVAILAIYHNTLLSQLQNQQN